MMTKIVKSNIEKLRKEKGLDKKDIEKYANVLAVSFEGYPLFEYFCNYNYSVAKMRTFWKVSLKTMSDRTFFVSDSEDVNSLAIFSPYEKGGISTWRYIKAGGLWMLTKIGIKMAKTMSNFEKFAESIKDKYAKPGCWYLYVFVTMPECRGQGIGNSIMEPMMAYLDRHEKDCYLETLCPVNVEIYKRYNFELKESVQVPGTDLTLYAMLRTARKKVEKE